MKHYDDDLYMPKNLAVIKLAWIQYTKNECGSLDWLTSSSNLKVISKEILKETRKRIKYYEKFLQSRQDGQDIDWEKTEYSLNKWHTKKIFTSRVQIKTILHF